jgi:hypothetical protein
MTEDLTGPLYVLGRFSYRNEVWNRGFLTRSGYYQLKTTVIKSAILIFEFLMILSF